MENIGTPTSSERVRQPTRMEAAGSPENAGRSGKPTRIAVNSASHGTGVGLYCVWYLDERVFLAVPQVSFWLDSHLSKFISAVFAFVPQNKNRTSPPAIFIARSFSFSAHLHSYHLSCSRLVFLFFSSLSLFPVCFFQSTGNW